MAGVVLSQRRAKQLATLLDSGPRNTLDGPLSQRPKPYLFENYVALTPSGGIPARSGTALGTAVCVMYAVAPDGTLSATSFEATICNLNEVALPASSYVVVHGVYGGGYVAVMGPLSLQTHVTDVQVSGVELQKKTREEYVMASGAESGWTTWHTGEACDGA